MAWWDKIVSAAKSAVNKAKSFVKKVSSSVKKAAEKALKKAKDALKKAAKKAKDAAKKAAKKAKDKIKKAKKKAKEKAKKAADKAKEAARKVADAIRRAAEAAKEKAAEAVRKAAEAVRKRAEDATRKAVDAAKKIADAIKEKAADAAKKAAEAVKKVADAAKEKAAEALRKVKEKAEALTWKGKLLNAFKSAFKIKLPVLGTPQFSVINSIYTLVTGKRLTERESAKLELKALDWILPVNALSVLFLGKNLDGKSEEFGTTQHYIDLILGLAIIVPAGRIGVVASRLGFKAGTKFGLKGFTKLATTKIDDAAKLFKILKVSDQTKLLGQLAKTDDGIKIINQLLAKKALHKTLVKPTISIVDKAIAKSILEGAGLSRFLTKALRPKTIIWSLTGMISIIGLAYGIPFGTSWLAKEGIKEQFEIPLADRMRSYRFDPTIEKLEIIRDDIKKLRAALPIARETIMKVAWLWPLTREAWEFYANNLYFVIEQYERELELLLPPELMVLPEKVEAVVRDIIDGDTIDVDLEAKDQETGRDIKLPEYRTTGHARVRIVGINAPEKSPKGEILCTGIEIVKVEKEFADDSRDALLPLNDRKVILKIDLENPIDTYSRILAVVELAGQDIGLRQIKEGLACHYFREDHKYVDDDLYSEETLDAKDEGTGMWKGLEEVEKEEDKIKIRITSTPTNAKLFLDDVALRHNTPSDEIELSDVIHLFTLGDHVLSAEKAGLSAMEDIEIEKGDNGTINLDLELEPIEEEPTEEEIAEEELEEEIAEEEVEEEEIEEEVIEEVTEPVKVSEIPKPYTSEQAWALNEAFDKILILTESTEIMSNKERKELINSFAMYTDGQKEILNLLWKDLIFYTQGRKQLSADEYIALKEKYQGI